MYLFTYISKYNREVYIKIDIIHTHIHTNIYIYKLSFLEFIAARQSSVCAQPIILKSEHPLFKSEVFAHWGLFLNLSLMSWVTVLSY